MRTCHTADDTQEHANFRLANPLAVIGYGVPIEWSCRWIGGLNPVRAAYKRLPFVRNKAMCARPWEREDIQ